MRRGWRTAAPLLLGLASCQLVAGIEDRKVDPLPSGCALPTVGEGRIRLANLVPQDAHADFCVRATGAAYVRPILRDGGRDCPNGYAYADVSAPFAVPVGRIDVKAIPAGSTCAAPALSEAIAIDVGADLVVTVARIGASVGPEQIVGLAETTPANGAETKIRLVHAAGNVPSIYVGAAKDPRLPTDVAGRLVADAVPFGKAIAPQSHATVGSIDPHGYVILPPTDYDLGVAADGATKALLVAHFSRTSTARTLFAIGDVNSPSYPVRGLVCADENPNGIATVCTLTALATLSVDMFNAGLYGANAVDESARRPVIFDQLSKRTSDLICLTEVGRKADRDALIATAKIAYPYAVTATTDLNTQPTDPTDQNGRTPAVPTIPPCKGPVDPQLVDDAYQCMVDKCDSKLGDPAGVLAGGSDCISSKCASKFIPLLDGDRNHARCFGCIIVNATSYTSFADSKNNCNTDAHNPYNFAGETPSMILSRYPLSNPDVYVLPSWLYRRSVLFAKVELEQGTSVDFYCAQLSSPLLDALLPYAGDYSNGNDATGYDVEQLLQVKRTIDYVKTKSAGRPAILAGDWHASEMQASPVLDDLNPEVFKTLRAAFTEALPSGYQRSCTYCPLAQNAYNGDKSYAWLDAFLYGFPDRATTDAAIFFDQRTVTLSDGTTKGNLSQTFGFNVRVIRP